MAAIGTNEAAEAVAALLAKAVETGKSAAAMLDAARTSTARSRMIGGEADCFLVRVRA